MQDEGGEREEAGGRSDAAESAVTLESAAARTGRALDNPVLRTGGRATMIDGVLAAAVLLGLVLNAGPGWWWAGPAAGYVLVYYAVREVREIFRPGSVMPLSPRRWIPTGTSFPTRKTSAAGPSTRSSQLL